MAELNIVEKVIALEAVELLKALSPEQLSRIASIAREVRYRPGETIFEPSGGVDALFIVLDGTVDLSRDGVSIVTARQNEVLGAWALFDDEPMQVAAKAIDDVHLLRINRDDFYDLLSDNIEIAASIFATLVRRFRKLVEQG
ncbi:MAG: cyclic nucleotide-binding domain-containing protein [Bryobacterales bacterium]|jgi:CRP-like cAMP-binding protein|nr:cyclic nucleotide-binding domain-containing protein [Bryobacterales bacterium]